MWLAVTSNLFQPRWTADIHREWMSKVLTNRPDLSPERIERTRALMDSNVEHCLVTGYEELIAELTLPDADDRHVLAAAIQAQASVIVTFNLRDFPEYTLSRYGIKAQHPDQFMGVMLKIEPEVVCATAEKHRQSLKNPPRTRQEYLETLLNQGLPGTVASLRGLMTVL
jgi:hypothetical protein